MGSYSGSSDWDDLPERDSFEAFKPTPAPSPSPSSSSSSDEMAVEAAPLSRKRLNSIVAFDTTGSMTPWVENVQNKMEYLAAGLIKLMDMEITFIGVGDHGDGRNMLQIQPPSGDVERLKEAAHKLQPTDGQDTPEAFECLFKVLNAADYDVPTVLILITDSIPHGMEEFSGEDDGCPFGVEWHDELDLLRDKLQKVYLVSCATDPQLLSLQKKMVGENAFVQLDSVYRLTNLIMALCMEEAGDLEFFMSLLEKQRGPERKRELLQLLGEDVVIGAFVRDLPPLHETEKPVSFDPVQTTFLQKLVREATLKEGVTVDKAEFFSAIVCVDYFTEVIAARPTLLGDIAVVVEELDKMADYLDPDLELLVRYVGVYIGKDLKGEALFKKGSQEAIARRHERTNAAPAGSGDELDLFHEAVGNFVSDQIRHPQLRALLPQLKGRNDLRALFLLDAMATAMPHEELPPLEPLLPAVMEFLGRLTQAAAGWSLREHVERLKARLP